MKMGHTSLIEIQSILGGSLIISALASFVLLICIVSSWNGMAVIFTYTVYLLYFSLQEELDFYQITSPIELPIDPILFVVPNNNEFTATNNNKTITRKATKHAGVRLNKELVPKENYEWTIKLDSITNSYWLGVGVADTSAITYNQMYGISSSNQAYSCGQYQQQISFLLLGFVFLLLLNLAGL
jgi:hypothetical protein